MDDKQTIEYLKLTIQHLAQRNAELNVDIAERDTKITILMSQQQEEKSNVDG